MNLKNVVRARIHPAIGIARVGNARPTERYPDYFIGPEVPYPVAPPDGGYRDDQGRLKRQAARFRIYGYDKDGQVVGELTAPDAQIEWQVHIANKKAAWYNFDVALDLPEASSTRSARRNLQIQGADRSQLAIDPGARSVSAAEPQASFDTGSFFGVPVYLGTIEYRDNGRLLFLGGRGVSAPVSPEFSITTFANNAGWHDDTSDGPVSATVRIGRRKIPVESAWVVTGPPNYAPDLVASQTMYDTILQALGWMVNRETKIQFTRDILPIFQQFVDAQWVNGGFAAQFGWQGVIDFMRPEFLRKLATPPVKTAKETSDPFLELRRLIFRGFRDPNSSTFDPLRWPMLYGDAFFSFDNPPGPRDGFAISKTVYSYLQKWEQGDFDGDYDAGTRRPASIDDVDVREQPETLDRAALHFCIGGPFHPGCEMTWPMRNGLMYRAPFRLRQRPAGAAEPDYGEFMTPDIALADGGPLCASGPGDVTKWLAVPWQTDTASCRAGYDNTEFPSDTGLIPAFWPSRVPDNVLTEASYRVVANRKRPAGERKAAFHRRDLWVRFLDPNAPFLTQISKMVDHFHELGTVERRQRDLGPDFPPVIYVETLPPGTVDPAAGSPAPSHSTVNRDFNQLRFRRRSQRA